MEDYNAQQELKKVRDKNKNAELRAKCDICDCDNKHLKMYKQVNYCPDCLRKVYTRQDHKKALSYKHKVGYYDKRRHLDT